jgi:hypothetical protein
MSEMVEMVERVTEAIKADMARQLGGKPTHPHLDPVPSSDFHATGADPRTWTDPSSGTMDLASLARAAIEAMREPTEAMVKAAEIPELHDIRGPVYLSGAAAWRAMNDEALKP